MGCATLQKRHPSSWMLRCFSLLSVHVTISKSATRNSGAATHSPTNTSNETSASNANCSNVSLPARDVRLMLASEHEKKTSRTGKSFVSLQHAVL